MIFTRHNSVLDIKYIWCLTDYNYFDVYVYVNSNNKTITTMSYLTDIYRR